MFSKFNTSDTPSYKLRRPYSARRGNGFQDAQFDRPEPVYDCSDGLLDLSIHHPSTPFANRFAPLARPEASVQRDREFYASRPHRRSRNSRGTKEAKKRRDSRRNKRKFAVHLLNEQLSRDIGETLLQYNIHASPLVGISPPVSAATAPSTPQDKHDNESTHVAPYAPQLPPVIFHGFSLPEFPPLVVPRNSSPSSPLAGVPSWCPPIPSLTNAAAWPGELPQFYDLSCLREPKDPQSEEGKRQSLQLWKGTLTSIPKKESRFFPPRSTSPRPTVRLPPVGLTCGMPDAQDSSEMAWKDPNDSTKPDSITQAIERIIAAARAVEVNGKESQLPSAANLWNILVHSPHDPIDKLSEQDSGWKDQDVQIEDLPQSAFDVQHGPFELAGTEIPYVHNNSLTGYANETATHHTESNVLGDSAIYLADMVASGSSATPTYELYGVPQTRSLPNPEELGSGSCSTALDAESYISVVAETQAEVTEGILEDSVAHFESEQNLFAASPSMDQPAESSSASVCDLATFLSMGHVQNCWCLACEEEPELVSDATVVESEDSLTEEDGWMMWSSTECEVETASITAPTCSGPNEKRSSSDRQCMKSGTWDQFLPRRPRRARTLVQSELDVPFLGYFDDGAAFGRADEDEWD